MRVLTEDALMLCDHGGTVKDKTSQSWVTINSRKVLVATDPEGCSISGCPNVNFATGMKPCTNTMKVLGEKGYSEFIKVDGHKLCLDTVTGLTNGTPPGTVKYTVKNPGQTLVGSDT
jgi:hypothetical protein